LFHKDSFSGLSRPNFVESAAIRRAQPVVSEVTIRVCTQARLSARQILYVFGVFRRLKFQSIFKFHIRGFFAATAEQFITQRD
jgi:hypothetical protein